MSFILCGVRNYTNILDRLTYANIEVGYACPRMHELFKNTI